MSLWFCPTCKLVHGPVHGNACSTCGTALEPAKVSDDARPNPSPGMLPPNYQPNAQSEFILSEIRQILDGNNPSDRGLSYSLVQRVFDLHGEAKDCDKLNERLSSLLRQTCDGLKGQPPSLVLYSWHDLPVIAEKYRAALEQIADWDGEHADEAVVDFHKLALDSLQRKANRNE